MHNMKKKAYTNSNDAAKQPKERHIVTWSQEEDDILREQIRLHGTENWAIIASKFQDKTTRQCRRRWYTYLNSDFKKGGWSPEEDMLLCEAQKIFGNRWTEIAKVVSGRTDNAVKNRFSTLCKKRAKQEAMAKENNTSYINLHNKRVLLQEGLDTTGTQEVTAPLKKIRRSHIPVPSEFCAQGEKVLQQGETNQQLRPPFTVLNQDLPNQPLTEAKDALINAAQGLKVEGTFLKKNDPKITALMQQAELLSSLALKVNTENTDHSLENAWKVLQDFLNQTREIEALPDIDLQLEEFKDLIEDLRSSNEETQPSWRQPDLCQESPDGSEKSTGSTHASHTAGPEDEMAQTDKVEQIQISENRNQPLIEEKTGNIKPLNSEAFAPTADQEDFPSFHEAENYVTVPAPSTAEFSSPPQVTPLFRSLAAGIPSPHFSESERNFLMKALGMESPYAHLSSKPSQPPPTCKRVLLHSL